MKRRQLINDYATRQVPATIGWPTRSLPVPYHCLIPGPARPAPVSMSRPGRAGYYMVIYLSAGPRLGRHGFIARWAGFCWDGPGRILGKTKT